MSAMSAAMQQADYPQPVLTAQEKRLLWLVRFWQDMQRINTCHAWQRVSDVCYGAVQLSPDSMHASDHETFETLWDVAIQRRIDAAEQESA